MSISDEERAFINYFIKLFNASAVWVDGVKFYVKKLDKSIKYDNIKHRKGRDNERIHL